LRAAPVSAPTTARTAVGAAAECCLLAQLQTDVPSAACSVSTSSPGCHPSAFRLIV
jgi:hypothetical protein